MLAWRADPLDIVEHDQAGVEGVGRCGDVIEVERRSNEGEPAGEVGGEFPYRARLLRNARRQAAGGG